MMSKKEKMFMVCTLPMVPLIFLSNFLNDRNWEGESPDIATSGCARSGLMVRMVTDVCGVMTE
jgi:hypothetical protein